MPLKEAYTANEEIIGCRYWPALIAENSLVARSKPMTSEH